VFTYEFITQSLEKSRFAACAENGNTELFVQASALP
jgi:hypothetical protein